MDKLFFTATVALLMMFSSFAQAEGKAEEGVALDDSPVYMQAEVTWHSSKGNATLIGKRLYGEYAIKNFDTSVSGEVYADADFESTTIGISQKFDDLSIGIGAGKVQYGGARRTSVSAWLYYEAHGTKASLEMERYLGDSETKYYKGYIHTPVNETVFVGLYSETGYGTGPLVGMHLGKQVQLMLTARPDHLLVSLSTEF